MSGKPVTLSNLDNSLSGVKDGKSPPSGKISVFKPNEKRKCTDILMVALFIVFWIGMFVIGIYAFSNSELDSLLYKRDYQGNFCKGDNGKLLFPIQFPTGSGSNSGSDSDVLPGVCVKTCPKMGDRVADPYGKYDKFGIIPVIATTVEAYGICFPSKENMKNMTNMLGYSGNVLGYGATMKRFGDDVYEGSAAILVIGGIVTAIVSMIWLFTLANCTTPIVWGSILAFFGVFVAGAYIFGCNGWNWSGCSTLEVPALPNSNNTSGASTMFVSDEDLTTGYKAAFFIFVILASLVALMTCCLLKQIRLAIAIMSEVSKALMQMFSLVFFPIIPFVMLMVFYVWWSAVTVALFSLEPTATNTTVTANLTEGDVIVYGYTTQTSNLWWLHFFGLLWTTQVIEGITIMTIAGAFCAWYWRDDKSELGHAPVLASFWRTMRYHIGTVIFGSLIIAIIQFIRAVLAYIKQKMKEHNENGLVKMALCVMQCFFACLESCMKYIGKNAYIITAMKGTSFCHSAFKGLKNLFANAGRVTALNTAAAFVVAISKLMIMTVTSLIAYGWLNSNEDIGNPLGPTIVTAVLAYGVTHVVMGMYDMGTDTLLMCVLEDEAVNRGSKQYYAPPSITKLLPPATTPKA
jgi:hypothetical protein